MQKIIGIFLAIFLMAPMAMAASSVHICEETPRLLNGVALNASEATRTFTIGGVAGYDILVISTQYTHANDGALTFTCTGKSAGATDASVTKVDTTMTTCSTSSGTCTLNWSGVVVTPSLTADKDFNFVLGILGEQSIKCIISHGGSPGSGDLVTVTARACTSGR